jgi:site-specific recombinase XerD
MKKSNEAVRISRYISEFLKDYAPNFLTHSDNTLRSYKDALTLYILFLEYEKISPGDLNRHCFERNYIEKWIKWLRSVRKCCPDTCNVRLGSLRVFLEFIGTRDIELIYLYLESKGIKLQKCVKKKVNGLSRKAVTEILKAPNISTKTGKRDLVFLTVLYATAGRLDEVRSIKISHLHLDAEKPYLTLIGKGQKMRTAYLLPRVVAHIRVYLKEIHISAIDPEAYLFFSCVGGIYVKLTEPALDKRIKLHAKKAHEKCNAVPLNTHAHQFRHAKASHWIEDGLNIVQVSFLLGHEQLETTMKYLDITTEEKIKALATLESETEKSVNKKWRVKNNSLSDFCGLKR